MLRHISYIILLLFAIAPVATVAESRDFVVVIDAGHGGHDHGAIGPNKGREKDINLGVALKLGKLIEDKQKDVKVVYTRKGDYFKTLQERADIANNAGGDLFISIHTNSVDKRSKNRRTVKGASTYTLGLHRSADNLAVAKRENAVMMLEDDFTETYQGFDPNSTESYIIFELNQNKHMDQSIEFASRVQNEMKTTAGRDDRGVRQAGFWVLFKTSMPAVLIELDFVCNPTCEKFLTSDNGQQKFAKAIYNAFEGYKSAYDLRTGTHTHTPPLENENKESFDSKNDQAAGTSSDDGTIMYQIQFLSSPKQVKGNSPFKGLKNVSHYRDGKMYKYTIGNFSTMAEAQRELKKVQKKFSDAFIIKVCGGKRIK